MFKWIMSVSRNYYDCVLEISIGLEQKDAVFNKNDRKSQYSFTRSIFYVFPSRKSFFNVTQHKWVIDVRERALYSNLEVQFFLVSYRQKNKQYCMRNCVSVTKNQIESIPEQKMWQLWVIQFIAGVCFYSNLHASQIKKNIHKVLPCI